MDNHSLRARVIPMAGNSTADAMEVQRYTCWTALDFAIKAACHYLQQASLRNRVFARMATIVAFRVNKRIPLSRTR
ncbi:hypothetical protein QA635_10855 [Bradyrhizobium brasilense]|uniref:hypothetical protein n=1 Tax=Bradyrhizobium brasilense TaxID=1419277 RepID=UPI0024B06C9B|nr:hypothetical protein [Bradyrhizobium australafricanum]WFU34860.1 hypothetical protein QA635_10855 [Bradyrhizobium australafricanum]